MPPALKSVTRVPSAAISSLERPAAPPPRAASCAGVKAMIWADGRAAMVAAAMALTAVPSAAMLALLISAALVPSAPK